MHHVVLTQRLLALSQPGQRPAPTGLTFCGATTAVKGLIYDVVLGTDGTVDQSHRQEEDVMSQIQTLRGFPFVALTVFMLVASLGSRTLALTSCNTTKVFSTDTTLTDDYQCNSGSCSTCISVTNGAKLELK